MARSLNRVTLIGNLTRDPEMRYTPKGTAVATFSIATNRSWKTETGDTKEDVEFHRIVAWDKLAEICAQLLKKGSKAFVEGRLQTRKWQTKEGEDRTTTEIVITDMLLLDSKGSSGEYSGGGDVEVPDDFDYSQDPEDNKKNAKGKPSRKSSKSEEDDTDDIPF